MKKRLIRFTATALATLLLLFVFSPLWVVLYGRRLVYTDVESVPVFNTAIVFGAAITPYQSPRGMLRDRLLTVVELYRAGKIEQILVSGDNREADYDEPGVMADFLIQNGVAAAAIERDPAGLRTYDTCKRAGEIWNVKKALLITQGYHLPRAIFTCRQLGVESYGLSGTLRPYQKSDYFKVREVLAIYQAMVDLFVVSPSN